MATNKNQRDATIAKALNRRPRPSMQTMQNIKSAARGKTSVKKSSAPKRSSAPKMVGKQKVDTKGKSLAKNAPQRRASRVKAINDMRMAKQVYEGFRKARPQNYRFKEIPKAKVVQIEGRHYPRKTGRYKTGYMRPVRETWMTNGQWRLVKAITRMPEKWMSKALRKTSKGESLYGKEGPGHAGYGTGAIQHWFDYILRQNKGLDPHQVSFAYLLKDAADVYAQLHGGETFKQRYDAMKNDKNSAMKFFLDNLKAEIPGLEKVSKKDIQELMEHKDFLATFGPDGRMK